MVDVQNKRTNKLLRDAITRTQQALKGSEMNFALRAGETMLKGGNFIGIKSKDVIILLVDTNSNGHFFDAKDRIIVSAAGTTAILDYKCKILGISKEVALAEKVKRASRMLGTGQTGVPEDIVNDVKLKELAKIITQLLTTFDTPATN